MKLLMGVSASKRSLGVGKGITVTKRLEDGKACNIDIIGNSTKPKTEHILGLLKVNKIPDNLNLVIITNKDKKAKYERAGYSKSLFIDKEIESLPDKLYKINRSINLNASVGEVTTVVIDVDGEMSNELYTFYENLSWFSVIHKVLLITTWDNMNQLPKFYKLSNSIKELFLQRDTVAYTTKILSIGMNQMLLEVDGKRLPIIGVNEWIRMS